MSDEATWRASRAKRLQAATIPVCATPLISLLASTWTWRFEGQQHLDALHASGQPYVLAVWHGRILPGLGWLRHRHLTALASENFDGEWIARILERFGFTMVRGSTSRGGVRALVRLAGIVRSGRSTVITVDGPRGPARQAQAGAVWIAQHVRAPIVPFHIEASRAWTVDSWDHSLVPKPFARLYTWIGEPLWCHGGSDEDIAEHRVRLDEALRACERGAAAMVSAARTERNT